MESERVKKKKIKWNVGKCESLVEKKSKQQVILFPFPVSGFWERQVSQRRKASFQRANVAVV